MKTVPLTLIFLFTTILLNAQPTNLQWARNMFSTGTCESNSVKVDAAGNVLTTGNLQGTADFDPGPGVFNLTSAGEEDIFISKLDASGNFVWAKRIGSYVSDQAQSIAVDNNGDVYVTGWFSGGFPPEVDFDPGPGVFNLITVGISAYILKLAANGDFVWARAITGDNNTEKGIGLGLDAAGNLFVTGAFGALANFDPGFSNFSLMSAGELDIFLAKFDPAGNFIWAKQVGSATTEYPFKLATDVTGNVLLTGFFNETTDFDPGAGVFNLVSAGGTDLFVCKLDNNGDFIWAKRMGGITNDFCYGVTTDLAGNVFLATRFTGTFDADPGPGVFNVTTAGQFDAFICKLNAAGDFQWAKTWGGALFNEQVFDIATDAAGNVYTGGSFGGTVDFDPGPAQFLLTASSPNATIFYSKFDGNGNFLWAVRLEGGIGIILSLYINAANQIVSTGFFVQTIDWDPNAGVFNLTAGVTDVFVHKLGQSVVLPLTLLDFSGAAITTGNLLQWKTAQEINTKDFEIEWGIDGIHFQKIATQQATGNSTTSQYSYLHTTRVDGDNYYRLKMQDKDGRATYSSVIRISTKITSPAITVFPNPVIDIVELNIQSLKNENIVFSLYSNDGKLVAARSFQVLKGSNLLRWNIQSIAAGNYFIVAANKEHTPITIIKR